MGRIIASVVLENMLEPENKFRCDALVDTGASHMVLPVAWRPRLGNLKEIREVEFETATQDRGKGIVCAPVRLQIEGFPPVAMEVLFVEMTPKNGDYEPLIGYLVLEHSQAAVDMLGHRLIFVKHTDLKSSSLSSAT